MKGVIDADLAQNAVPAAGFDSWRAAHHADRHRPNDPWSADVPGADGALGNADDQPRAGKLVNSARIQALSEAVATGNDANVWTAVDDLDELDPAYLSDVDGSRAFCCQARGQARGKLSPTTYAVIAGNNLSRIADRMLGDSARWQRTYTLNRAENGHDPDHITPTQQLKLPAL
ncbi:MAG: hypothetical protein GXP62_19885 [Oligoflexia bacterium]|nr:hypothetical protein [Oligoflexia bacterium]